jgi:methylmalonyl-CoA epimerase
MLKHMADLFQFPIDHIGIAVPHLDDALLYHQRLFGGSVVDREVLADRGLEIAFLACSNTRLEFLAPLNLEDQTNIIARFLKKRGAGMHHICYEVPRLEDELARLAAAGVPLIDTVPRPGAQHSRIAFIMPSKQDGLLVELCDYPQRTQP